MIYSGNRYLTLDEMKANAEYIYLYLTAENWTINAICGMLGNMQVESTLNPSIWEGFNEGNFSGGYGLVQWTPATKYTDWCDENDLDFSLMDSNLLRILYEVDNNEQWGHPSLSFLDYTMLLDSPRELAILFEEHYERARDPDLILRGDNAEFWYEYLSGLTFKKHRCKVFLYIKKRSAFI